jgi:hypothetical protein
MVSCLSFPILEKGYDMRKCTQKPGACLCLAEAGRRRSPTTKILLILGEILLITCLTAALAPADNQTNPHEKGNYPMQQAATVSVKDVPPLDRSLPGHVETFTFGLG